MMKNVNKTKVMISGESHKGVQYTVLEDGHMVLVVEVLVETQYSVLSIRNGKCSGYKGSSEQVFCV